MISLFVILFYNAVYVIKHASYKSNNAHCKLQVGANHKTGTTFAVWKHFPGLQIENTGEDKSEAVYANSCDEFKDLVYVGDHARPQNANAVVAYCC